MIDLAYELARVNIAFPPVTDNLDREKVQAAYDEMLAEMEAEEITEKPSDPVVTYHEVRMEAFNFNFKREK